MARAAVALAALVLATVGAVGCGEEAGVAGGATVTAYVEAPLCERPGVSRVQNESGEALAVEFACLPAARGPELGQGVGGGRRIDLATVGANARRATEDSTAVAYIGAPGTVARFARPILEAAGIALLTTTSADRAMQQVLDTVANADPSSLRNEVREILDPP